MRRFSILLVLVLASTTRAAEPVKLMHDVYGGYFVVNKFEPKEPVSYAVAADQAKFDSMFGVAFVMGDKSHRLAKGALDANIVVTTIKRGMASWTFKVDSVTVHDGVVELKYTATEKKSDSASFSSPLIVSIPKGKYTAVEFVENGKAVHKLPIAAGAEK